MSLAKVVMITGASRGIGRACAELFGRHGCSVAVCWKADEAGAAACASSIMSTGASALCVRMDISDPVQVQDTVSVIEQRLGGIDILVNNAGVAASPVLFQDMDPQDMRLMLDVNTLGTMFCSRSVLPGMLSRQCGAIINISSVFGVSGGSCEAAYSASKAAVIGFTRALAKEVGPSGVRVNCVAPGAIQTDMLADYSEEDLRVVQDETPLGRIGVVDDVAQAVFFLASDEASFITGDILHVSGGFSL